MSTGFDLQALDTKTVAEEGAIVHLESPLTNDPIFDADGSSVTITILGADSEKLRAFDRKLHNRRMEVLQKQRNPDLSFEKGESEQVQKLAVATLAWQNIALDGELLDCTEANARKLYGDARFPWIAEQLVKAMNDRKRFFKNPSTSSAQ